MTRILPALLLLAGGFPALAENLQPFFAFGSGPAVTGADGGTITLTTDWNSIAGPQSAFIMKSFANGTTRKTMADQTNLSLLANRRYQLDWDFSVLDPTALGFVYSVNATENNGRKAAAFKNSARIVGIKGVSVSAGIDPLIGIASFDVFNDGTPLSFGEVDLGIAGEEVSTTTTRTDGSFKTMPELKDDLLVALQGLFTSAFIDPYSGLIVVPGVSTGDPQGTSGVDLGATFFTTADGIDGFVQVEVVPEPATLLPVSLSILFAAGFAAFRRRGPGLRGRASAAAFILLMLIAGAAPASAGNLQLFYSFRSGSAVTGPNGGTVTFTAEWSNVDGNQTAFIMPQIANGTTLEQAANQTALSLLANRRFRMDWRFTVKNRQLGGFNYYPVGTSIDGRKAMGIENSAEITGIKGMTISAGIDPSIGTASFDIFDDGNTLSPGDVTIGIAGEEFSTSITNSDGSFKAIPEIKADLLEALHIASFTSAYLDPGTGFITVPNVSTGDPESAAGFDAGASFFTSADGIGGFVQVEIVPEPATLAMVTLSGILIAGFRKTWRRQQASPASTHPPATIH